MTVGAHIQREGSRAVVAIWRTAELAFHIRLHRDTACSLLLLEDGRVADGALVGFFMLRMREYHRPYPGFFHGLYPGVEREIPDARARGKRGQGKHKGKCRDDVSHGLFLRALG